MALPTLHTLYSEATATASLEEGRLYRLPEAIHRTEVIPHGEAVDEQPAVLGLLVGPYERLVDGHDTLIAAPQTAVALLQLDLEVGGELAPLRQDERRDEVDTAPHRQLTDVAQHVGDGMLAHLLPRDRGDGLPHTRPEEAHILVDLGRGRYGGAGIAADDTLLDGDGGR